jgi:N6-adenosine-specific RNA methylase IME4
MEENNKLYKTLLIDPPWHESGGGKIKRGADKHYKLLKTDHIIYLLNNYLAGKVDDSAHCYLWVTNNHLKDGLKVMDSLGFTYKTNLVWVKTNFGIGQYFRGQHELLLFGTKGRGFDVKTGSKNISTFIGNNLIAKTIHSKKPNQTYDLIEQRSYGPYLEMFARNYRQNWDSWGDQLPNLQNTPETNDIEGI